MRVSEFRATIPIRSLEDVDQLERRAMEAAREHVANLGGEDALRLLIEEARSVVKNVLSEGRALEAFHGKELLRRFYDEYGKKGGWSYQTFCYQIAMAAKPKPRLRKLLEQPVRRIRQMVPRGLIDALDEAAKVFANHEGFHPDVAQGVEPGPDARAKWEAAKRMRKTGRYCESGSRLLSSPKVDEQTSVEVGRSAPFWRGASGGAGAAKTLDVLRRNGATWTN